MAGEEKNSCKVCRHSWWQQVVLLPYGATACEQPTGLSSAAAAAAAGAAGGQAHQARQGLLAGAAHAHQQGVATWVADDAGDAADVLDGVLKQHQIHRCTKGAERELSGLQRGREVSGQGRWEAERQTGEGRRMRGQRSSLVYSARCHPASNPAISPVARQAPPPGSPPPTCVCVVVLGQPLPQSALQALEVHHLVVGGVAAVPRSKVAEEEGLGVLGTVVVVNVCRHWPEAQEGRGRKYETKKKVRKIEGRGRKQEFRRRVLAAAATARCSTALGAAGCTTQLPCAPQPQPACSCRHPPGRVKYFLATATTSLPNCARSAPLTSRSASAGNVGGRCRQAVE